MHENKRSNSKDAELFVRYMKEQFDKIPRNLSAKEYRERAERNRSIAESYSRHPNQIREYKKYDLLSKKYEQLANEKERGIHLPNTIEMPVKPASAENTNIQIAQDEGANYSWIVVPSIIIALILFSNNFTPTDLFGLSKTTTNILSSLFLVMAFLIGYLKRKELSEYF